MLDFALPPNFQSLFLSMSAVISLDVWIELREFQVEDAPAN